MMKRAFCMRCGADVDEGRRACGCQSAAVVHVAGEPGDFEKRARRYAALRSVGLSEAAAVRLSPPDRVPS